MKENDIREDMNGIKFEILRDDEERKKDQLKRLQAYVEAIQKKVSIPAKKIGNYFPETYSKEQIEEVIFMLLDKWKQNREGVADAEDTV